MENKDELRKQVEQKLEGKQLKYDDKFRALLDYMIEIGDFYTGNIDVDEEHYERVKQEYNLYGEFGKTIIDWLWDELIKTYSPDVIEPVQLTFCEPKEQLEATKRLPAVVIPREHAQNLLKLLPERLSKREFEVGPVEETKSYYIFTYTKDEPETITKYTFLCDKKQSQIKDGKVSGIPTFGKLAHQSYFALHAFALVTGKTKLTFRPYEVLRFGDYYSPEELEQIGGMYTSLKNILRTLAYCTYETKDRKTGETLRIGHVIDTVTFDPKKKSIEAILPQETADFYKRYWNGQKGIGFTKYSMPVIKSRDLDKYDLNLDGWLAQIKGAGEKTYPISVRTLLIKKLGYSNRLIQQRGNKWTWKVMRQKLDKAQQRGTLKEYDLRQKENNKQYGIENTTKWRIRLVAQ